MKVYVVLKQTFDTEEKIVIRDGAMSEDGVKFVINPYDEYAVEEAIRLKERSGGQVTVVSVGPDRAAEALRTALAMGADEAVLISDDRLSDEYAVSEALAAFLTDQAFDLILGGNFSVDNGAGQVAVRLAELLGIPHVSSIVKLEAPGGGSAVVQRDAEGDLETLDVSLPALFTAQQGLNEPRYPSLPGIMKAKKKPFKRLTADDLGLTADRLEGKTARTSLSLPPVRQAGLILQGDLPQQAAKLVELLRTQSKAL